MIPAIMIPSEQEFLNEVSFMDAMAVYMGMEMPKSRDPVAEAEAALAYLERLWLFCKVSQRLLPHAEQFPHGNGGECLFLPG